MDNLWQLVFLSKATCCHLPDEIGAQMKEIVRISHRNNALDGITGAILWVDGYYCQILEGVSDALDRRFDIIQQDHRHGACKILSHRPIDVRDFPAEPIRDVGIFWKPVPNLSAALRNLGAISNSVAGAAVMLALKASDGSASALPKARLVSGASSTQPHIPPTVSGQ